MKNNIILIGMPQSGKSTIGKMVADRLNFVFKDMDRLIEEHYACRRASQLSCQEIYKKEGVDYFRNLEQDIFARVVDDDEIVIATGGSTPMHIPAFDKLTDDTHVFFLYCTLNILWKRITDLKEVPAVISAGNPFVTFQELYKSRLVHYLAFSHHKINATEKTKEQITEAIVSVTNPCVMS